MEKKQLKKKKYESPRIGIFHNVSDTPLMETSFPNDGGHTKAGDDGQSLNAKQALFFEEDTKENETHNQWDSN